MECDGIWRWRRRPDGQTVNVGVRWVASAFLGEYVSDLWCLVQDVMEGIQRDDRNQHTLSFLSTGLDSVHPVLSSVEVSVSPACTFRPRPQPQPFLTIPSSG